MIQAIKLLSLLFILLFISLGITLTIKHKQVRIVTTIFTSLFISLQAVSIYTTHFFIGYRFVKYLSYSTKTGFSFVPIILFVVGFLTILLLHFYIYSILIKKKNYKRIQKIGVAGGIIGIVFLIIQGRIIEDTKTLIPFKNDTTYKNDTMRYIAHAGGEIDGKIYTNTKEALDLNYQRGFRLFELDIRKTTDGQFVAVHEWKEWSTFTKYKGKYPVSHKEFLSKKIDGKYTPLDMQRINEWFEKHKDAILVTDKVNDPIAISKQFCDKSRLMMELFTEEAVNKGLECGILSAMPSQSIISTMKKRDVETLAQKGVQHIVVSINFAEQHQKLLQEVKKHHIKAYVYGLNFIPYLTEEDIIKYQMDYIYGMYAEKWDFNKQ